ncbi:MAG TPA: hypothetical protein VGA64_10485 [Candidatus Polarisedimenticolia bacterium]
MNRPGAGHGRAGRLACAVLLLLLPVAGAAAERTDGPLDNEAIVQLVMAGTTEAALLERLERSPVDFDLSSEQMQELRAAGVGERIIEAMRRRQAGMPRNVPSPTPAPVSTGRLALTILTDPKAKSPAEASVLAIRTLPPKAARPGGMEVGEVSDLAVAILCVTADHVPDHWETRTRLVDAPRHELLSFTSGSAEAKLKGFKVLYLKTAPEIDVDLPAGTHDLIVAAAGQQVGSRAWRLLATSRTRVTVGQGSTTPLSLRTGSRLQGSSMRGFGVTIDWRLDPSDPAAPEAP